MANWKLIFSFKALLGVLFAENKEASYAVNRLCGSLLGAIGYAYSGYVCVKYKLYLILGTLLVAILAYTFLEVKVHRDLRKAEKNSE